MLHFRRLYIYIFQYTGLFVAWNQHLQFYCNVCTLIFRNFYFYTPVFKTRRIMVYQCPNCPSVRPFHMSCSNLRTPLPIHFKFHRVIGIDGLTVCILYGEISNFHSRVVGLYSSNCRRFFVCHAVNWELLGQFTSNFAHLLELIVLRSVYFWWNFDISFQSYGTLFIKL